MQIVATNDVPKGALRVAITAEKQDETVLLPDGTREIRLGAGEKKSMTRRKWITLVRRIVTRAKAAKAKAIAVDFDAIRFASLDLSDKEAAELFAVNAAMANYEYITYKTAPEGGWIFVETIYVTGKVPASAKAGFDRGLVVGGEVNATRELANTPGGDMTPETLAHAAEAAAKGLKISVKVLGVDEMTKLGMGGILGVGRGSEVPPRFVIMEYWGAGKTSGKKPIVLVGKGVTFDSGGLNLKPSDGIYEMHLDMSGAAAVIHATVLAAKLEIKKNIIALVPAVENMPSGSSYHPGDLLRTMSGKTIEVLNTDAEGRVILSDALTYAERYAPRLVVDVATLTGAAMIALGQRACAIYSKDDRVLERVAEFGEEGGDYVWPMPLWDEYESDIRGTHGDWANTGKNRYGGSITAAMFLYQFAKNYPWVHIDMAPRMTAIDGEELAKGAAGAPVRLLWKLLESY